MNRRARPTSVELARWRRRLNLSNPSVTTQHGRVISWIRYDPKTQRYRDGEFEYEFRQYLNHLRLVRINRPATPERVFAIAELVDWDTRKEITNIVDINGKTVRPAGLTINEIMNTPIVRPSNEKPAVEDARRGVMPAYLDYLKRNGARAVKIKVMREELGNYYKTLGFEEEEIIQDEQGSWAVMRLDLSKFHLQEWE